jgi:hypothetical protein
VRARRTFTTRAWSFRATRGQENRSATERAGTLR